MAVSYKLQVRARPSLVREQRDWPYSERV